MAKNIMVAVDGSAHSDKCVEMGSDLASFYDATLYLFHVVPSHPVPNGVLDYAREEEIAAPAESVYLQIAEEKIIKAVEEITRNKKPKKVQVKVADGDPAAQIISFADEHDVDVIVLGYRGTNPIKDLLLGGVCSKVIHAASCSCVLVR